MERSCKEIENLKDFALQTCKKKMKGRVVTIRGFPYSCLCTACVAGGTVGFGAASLEWDT